MGGARTARGRAGDPGAGDGREAAAAPGGDAQLDEVLHAVSQGILAITRQLSTRDVLQMIVRSARSLLAARYAALGVPDDQGSFAEFVVDGISASQWAAIGPLPRQHGMLAVLLREGRPQRLRDIRADPRFEGWPAGHPVMEDFLGMPIADGGEVLGIIFLANKRVPGGFTARDEELLALLAAHAAIALTNARLYERSRELSAVQERTRLARDLHDAVSQKLFSIRAKARAAAILVPRDPARAEAELESVAELSGEAQAELRAVIDGLRPPDLHARGLGESVRRYAALAGRAHGIPVSVTAGPLPPLPSGTETVIYRVAQEALHNALRHSGARQVLVTLSRKSRRVLLEVSDDGRGFRPPPPALDPGGADGLPGPGLGLASMRDRAASAGGTLTVTSAPGQGTTVQLPSPSPARRPGAAAPAAEIAPQSAGSGGRPGSVAAARPGSRRTTGGDVAAPITVLIADDHPVVRQGLRTLLEVQDDIAVAGEAADGAETVEQAERLAPDVILLDLKLPGLDGVGVLKELHARGVSARALVLTSVMGSEPVAPAMQAGAAGYLYKDVDPVALVRAIRSVHDGNLVLAPDAASALPHAAPGTGSSGSRDYPPGPAALTGREQQVLGLMARGSSNREIARSLGVSEKTVKTHVSSVLAKLGVQDRTQAAVYAVRHGLDG